MNGLDLLIHRGNAGQTGRQREYACHLHKTFNRYQGRPSAIFGSENVCSRLHCLIFLSFGFRASCCLSIPSSSRKTRLRLRPRDLSLSVVTYGQSRRVTNLPPRGAPGSVVPVPDKPSLGFLTSDGDGQWRECPRKRNRERERREKVSRKFVASRNAVRSTIEINVKTICR